MNTQVLAARLGWVMACLLLSAAAPQVHAQELASSFDELRVLLRQGDTVTVTDAAGRETKGKVASISTSSIELLVAGNRRSFLEDDTRTIRQRRSDSLKNGTLWGLGVGAGLGLLSFVPDEDGVSVPTGEAVGSLFLMAGLGTAIGIGVDALFHSNDVIFFKPGRTSTRLRLSPLLTRDRKGALVSIGF